MILTRARLVEIFVAISLTSAALAAAAIVQASSRHPEGIEVSGAWVRSPAPGASSTAAFLSISNLGLKDDALTGVSADGARVQLRRTPSGDDRRGSTALLSRLPIPKGESVRLMPQGMQLMLTDLQAPLKEGQTLGLKLSFERASDIAVAAVVRQTAPGAQIETAR